MTIGNLPPKQGAKVVLTIEAPLTCTDDLWTLTLPSNLLEPNSRVKATAEIEVTMKSKIVDIKTNGVEFTATFSHAG